MAPVNEREEPIIRAPQMYTTKPNPDGDPARRYATLAVIGFHFTIMQASIALTVLCLIFGSLWMRTLLVLYLVFIFMVDNEVHRRGGRPLAWVKDSLYWRLLAEYFPVTLIRTRELDPSKNYVFGYHPHGIISVGAITNFGSNATKFQELFPGINMHLLSLEFNYKIPFFREYLLSLGMADPSKESCNQVLSSGPGSSLMLVLGGAPESLEAHPGTMTLALKNRKGFVKLALRCGASLVPVISFGENEIFRQVKNDEGTLLRRAQKAFTNLTGYAPPLVIGIWGCFPYPRPITSVVGAPIDLPKIQDPSNEDINKYHDMYVQGLVALYEAHKNTHFRQRTKSLQIIE